MHGAATAGSYLGLLAFLTVLRPNGQCNGGEERRSEDD
jgi:hypothetical protein